MFALAAARPIAARELLRDAPRSLAALSREHADGWGVALHADDWTIHRGTECAARCTRFDAVANLAHARLVIAHVRKKTVGPTSLANTHPFRRGRFVFAHNGTVRPDVLATLVASTSPARLAEVEGDTDSERLFAYLLTHVDALGVEDGIAATARALHAFGDPGPVNFVVSCGARIYAHRMGRELFALVRHSGARTATAAVASERLTPESWVELPERSLVALESGELRFVIDPHASPRAA